MNIVLACPNFFPDSYGGIETYTYNLAVEFLRRGHNVHILCGRQIEESSQQSISIEDEIYHGISIRRIRFDFSKRQKPIRAFFDQEITKRVVQAMAEWCPDVVHVMHFRSLSGAAVSVPKQQGIPVVVMAADFGIVCEQGYAVKWDGSLCPGLATFKGCWDCLRPRGMRTERIYDWASRLPEGLISQLARLKQATHLSKLGWLDTALMVHQRLQTFLALIKQIDLTIAPSSWLKDVLVMNGADSQRVLFSLYGIQVDNKTPEVRVQNSQLRFGFLGRIEPLKGVDVLIDAFNRLVSPHGATLTIHGAPHPSREEFEYAGRLWFMAKDNPRIIFGKLVNRDQIGLALGSMDVLVLPSRWYENSPIVVQEALQRRIPVIASHVAGVTDLIRNGENGLLFQIGDANDLASKMQRLIDEPNLVRHFSTRIQPIKTISEDAEWLLCKYREMVRNAEKVSQGHWAFLRKG